MFDIYHNNPSHFRMYLFETELHSVPPIDTCKLHTKAVKMKDFRKFNNDDLSDLSVLNGSVINPSNEIILDTVFNRISRGELEQLKFYPNSYERFNYISLKLRYGWVITSMGFYAWLLLIHAPDICLFHTNPTVCPWRCHWYTGKYINQNCFYSRYFEAYTAILSSWFTPHSFKYLSSNCLRGQWTLITPINTPRSLYTPMKAFRKTIWHSFEVKWASQWLLPVPSSS